MRIFIFIIALLLAPVLAYGGERLSIPDALTAQHDAEIYWEFRHNFGCKPNARTLDNIVGRARSNPEDKSLQLLAAQCQIHQLLDEDEIDGVSTIKQLAGDGYVPAIIELAQCQAYGTTAVPQDTAAAVKILRPFAESGNAEAQEVVGLVDGCSTDLRVRENGEKLLAHCAESGDLNAYRSLAAIHFLRKDEPHMDSMLKLAQLGSGPAMRMLIESEKNDLSPDTVVSVRSCLMQGVMYQDPTLLRLLALKIELGDVGCPKDPQLTGGLLLRAAALGDSVAASFVARARIGVLWDEPNDLHQAMDDLRYLADRGDSTGVAKFLLGELLYFGEGVPQDQKAGLQWVRKASDAGLKCAKIWLANPPEPTKEDTTAPTVQQKRATSYRHLVPVMKDAEWMTDPTPIILNDRKPEDQFAADMRLLKDWWLFNGPSPSRALLRRTARFVHKFNIAETFIALNMLESDRQENQDAVVKEANRMLLEAANHGEALAMAVYGYRLCQGFGMPADMEAGKRWIAQAQEKHLEAAETYLAMLDVTGPGGHPRNLQRGLNILSEQVDRHYNFAASPALFASYMARDWAKRDHVREYGNYYNNIPSFSFSAWHAQGYLVQVFSDDNKQQLEQIDEFNGETLGNSAMLVMESRKLSSGDLLQRNAMLVLLRRAESDGDIEASALLAGFTVRGEIGIRKNPELGLAILKSIVAHGEVEDRSFDLTENLNWSIGKAEAQWQLGHLYEKGEGVVRDLEKAKALITRAAVSGQKDAVRWNVEHPN